MIQQPASQKDTTCQDDFDPNSLNVEEAQQRIRQLITPLTETETISIDQALNRTLAQDILSTINIPPQTNSAMDGYGIKFSDIDSPNPAPLRVIGSVHAGTPFSETIQQGECVRIMTGAVIPPGVDTVVMQEHAELVNNSVSIKGRHQPGQNIRLAGEDLNIGDAAVKQGTLLKPTDIGIIASLGVSSVTVYRRLTAAIFSTGDELNDLDQPLQEGQIYDSNRHTLRHLLQQLNISVTDLGILKDEPKILEDALSQAKNNYDILITSGGVSVGDADYVKQTLEALGEMSFWKIAMKPGRPMAVGKLDHPYFFGLPGNPVSTVVTFYQIVLPALRYLMGQTETENPTLPLTCVSALKKRPGRTEYQRGIMFYDENGQCCVKTTGNQGSHVLSSMNTANCFIVLDQDSGNVAAGSAVKVQPFQGILGF